MLFFVTGAAGQLGHDVLNELYSRGYEGIGSDIADSYSGIFDGSAAERMPYISMDITDADSVKTTLESVHPDVVIHCAAWTAVDLAEESDKQKQVYAVNASGTRNIAEQCKRLDCKMIYLSTDYVFDGTGTDPWQGQGPNTSSGRNLPELHRKNIRRIRLPVLRMTVHLF